MPYEQEIAAALRDLAKGQTRPLITIADTLTAATQAEMEAGTETALRSMSPLRVSQAISALGGGGGDLLAANNLSDLDSASTALANLGGTTVGRAVFTAVSAAAARTAVGATTVGSALITAADALAARAAIGTTPDDNENRIINGDFGIWQRGTSGTANSAPVADRWFNGAALGTITQSRQAFALGDTFGVNGPTYFLRQSVVPIVGPSHFAATSQRVESVRSYAGQTITVLGWARRFSGAGDMTVEGSQGFGTGGSPSAGVLGINPTTVALSTSWETFAVVMNVPSVTGKTLGTDGRDSFNLNFWTSAGSDLDARTNNLGIQTIAVDLWGVHIRVGTWAAADAALYRARDPGTELALCQRYYEAFSATAGINGSYINGYSFSVTKRATPALNVVSGSLAGSTWQADTNRFVQINNSSGASGVGFGADSEL